MTLIKELKSTLTNYTKAVNKLVEFKGEHSKIFTEAELLEQNKEDIELLLKKLARETKQGVENSSFRVVVSRKFRSWFSFSEMTSHLSREQQDLVFSQCVGEVKIESPDNKKTLENLVKDNQIPAEARQLSFHEEEMSSAVSIKPLK